MRKPDSIFGSGVSLTSVPHPPTHQVAAGAPIGVVPLLNCFSELNFCHEQLAQMLVKLTDRIGIRTEKRKMAIDGLDRPKLGIGN